MNLIRPLREPGNITEALYHIDGAIEEALKKNASNITVSKCLSDALNKLQTEWLLRQRNREFGEIKSFQTMLIECIIDDVDSATALLNSTELRKFLLLEPKIMDHSILRQYPYRPNQEVDPALAKKASEIHHKTLSAYKEYSSQGTEESRERLIKRIANLLYIVRSNIAHGEKTPYGPDLKKRNRDELVCRVVVPFQKLLINLLLDKPDQKLVVYGTLAPEQPNCGMLEKLHGSFEECEVRGRITEIDQLFFFDWDPYGEPVNAKLFMSSSLPGYWEVLDRFEGKDYKRILIPVKKTDGISIANVYVANKNSEVYRWQQ